MTHSKKMSIYVQLSRGLDGVDRVDFQILDTLHGILNANLTGLILCKFKHLQEGVFLFD